METSLYCTGTAAKGGIGNEGNTKRILTIKETVAATGFTEYQIRNGIKKGVFPAFQIAGAGGKYFIDIELFQVAIRNQCTRNMKQSDDSNVVSINGIRRIKE